MTYSFIHVMLTSTWLIFILSFIFWLKLKASKCAFFLDSVEFLGHTISARGFAVEKGKVEVVEKWPQLTCVNEL